MSATTFVTVSTRGAGVWNQVKRRLGDIGLVTGVALLLIPFAFAVLTAIRPAADVSASPLGWPQSLTLENVVDAFMRINYAQSVANTVTILAGSCALTVAFGAMASYPLSRIGRSWANGLYRVFIIGTAVPIYVLIAPLYLLVRDLHILGTQLSVILVYTAMNLPIAVFFYTSFMRQVPVELEEAAAIDGAGPLRVFFAVIFPLLAPVTATLVTFISLVVWNDLIVPLVFLQGGENRTIMANAYALIDPNTVEPTTLFPAALLGVLPLVVVFSFLQRYVVAGISAGAVKS
ncbi:carbohydrate ABC transporter permease [Microlunatus sp. GCM10028923]|uniref:carbohydrate ABC transporter permease n=1 Tax=Microlunatus sp. GCM10028923 TaxID=3273400 RepID=UPI003622121A